MILEGVKTLSLLQYEMRADVRLRVISDQFGLPRDVSYAAVCDRNSGHEWQSIFALPKYL